MLAKDVEKLEPLITAGRNVKWCSSCGKQLFLKRLKIELPCDPEIPVSSIAVGRRFVSFPNSCVEALISNVIAFGGGQGVLLASN